MKERENTDFIANAWKIKEVLEKVSDEVDDLGRYPYEGIELIKKYKLLSIMIPEKNGGYNVGIRTISEIAQILSSGCLSTSMIWTMHCQQVMVLINHLDGNSKKHQILDEISQDNKLIASVTSEYSSNGDLSTSYSPFTWTPENKVYFIREAPSVTGGMDADAYLITVREDTSLLNEEVSLIYAKKEEVKVNILEKWNAMGLKGTNTDSIRIEGEVDRHSVLQNSFEDISQITMIPVAHIMWVSCWLGATKKAYQDVLKVLRKKNIKKSYNYETTLYRLAEVRLKLDAVNIYLDKMIHDYDKNLNNSPDELKTLEFKIHLNNLKIIGSEYLFKAVDLLIEISGIAFGYKNNTATSLERTFRDMRSSSLMYHNDRLKLSNGRFCIVSPSLLPGELSNALRRI